MKAARYRKSGIAALALVIIVVVIVAAVGVGSYYYISTGNKGATSNQTTSTTQTTQTNPSSSSASSSKSSSSIATSTEAPGSSTSSSVVSSSQSSSQVISSSTQSVTTTSQSFSTTQTFSCSTTYTSATATGVAQLTNFANLFGNFSAMSITMQSSYNGTTSNIGASFVVNSHSGSGTSAIYQVAVNESAGGQPFSGIATYLGDGTAQSVTVDEAGQKLNFTGQQATSFFESLMSAFFLETTATNTYQLYLNSGFVSTTNQSTINIGQSSLSVTNYKANNTPFSGSSCGYAYTVNSLLLQVGTVQGSSYGSLVTYMSYSGTSQGTTSSYVFQVTSITKA